jgi:hypothetical protein
VRFRVDGEINDYCHCHCSQCRRLHGAAFATFAGVSRADFQYLDPSPPVSTYASSESHDRLFCSVCGSNIMVVLSDEPDNYYLALSTIDGDPALPPAYHIFVGSRAPWYEIRDAAPQYDEFPPEDQT